MRKIVPLLLAAACSSAKPAVIVAAEDRRVHDDAVVVDMHGGIAEAMYYEQYDLFAAHADHHEDLPRLPGSEEEQLKHLKAFAERGVRSMTLSWSSSSPIGGSTAQEQQEGLTEFGKRAIPEMERLGIVPDLSHASDPLFWDVIRLAKKP